MSDTAKPSRIARQEREKAERAARIRPCEVCGVAVSPTASRPGGRATLKKTCASECARARQIAIQTARRRAAGMQPKVILSEEERKRRNAAQCRAWYERHREERREYNRQWRTTRWHAMAPERDARLQARRAAQEAREAVRREAVRARYRANREAILAAGRAYYLANRERKRAYYLANRERRLAYANRYNAAHPTISLSGETVRIDRLPSELKEVARQIKEARQLIRTRQTKG